MTAASVSSPTLLFHEDKDIEMTEMAALSPITAKDATKPHCLLDYESEGSLR